MNEAEIILRVERFERTVATCLCALPCLFAAQCLLMSASAPVFSAMFADFGSRLPALTTFIIGTWGLWAAIAVAAPVASFVVARKAQPRFAVVFSTIAGLVMFAVAQTVTVAMFLPVFQLGAVAEGVK